MAEYQLLEERLISGKGVLKVPDGKDDFRHSVLYLDIIREPKNKYLNRNWAIDKSIYAFLNFRRNGYCIDSLSMEYEKQSYDGIADISGQTLLAVKCAYEGVLISFVNLAIGLGLTITAYQDLIKDYENLQLGWDEVLIKCYADTAIQARLYGVKYDVCDSQKDKKRKPPPPPPPLPKVPPGTPIGDISYPYDPDTNDEGNSSPYEGDESPPPPPPWGETGQCTRYAVQFAADGYLDVPGGTIIDGLFLWGELTELEARTDAMYFKCRGRAEGQSCGEPQWVQWRTYQYPAQKDVCNFRVYSITPAP